MDRETLRRTKQPDVILPIPSDAEECQSNKCFVIPDRRLQSELTGSEDEIPPTPEHLWKFSKPKRKPERSKNRRKLELGIAGRNSTSRQRRHREEDLPCKSNEISSQSEGATTPKNSLPPPAIPNIKEVAKQKTVNCSRIHEDIPLEIQYATGYIDDIIDVEYSREENCWKVSERFLEGKLIDEVQRKVAINFLIKVNACLRNSSSSLYQAAKMFDAILDLSTDIVVSDLRLIALATLWIAIKHNEVEVPSAEKMISFTKGAESAELDQLYKWELKILETLQYNIVFPNPFYFAVYYLWSLESLVNDESVEQIYYCINYMIDIALLDKSLARIPGALLGATATQTTLYLVMEETYDKLEWPRWKTNKMTRFKQEEMDETRSSILNGILHSAKNDLKILAVYKKYKQERYSNVSTFLMAKVREACKTEVKQ